MELGDGNYSGCLFGWGDVPPFEPPCDCPTCNGSGIEGSVIGTAIPHAGFGDPESCGCLNGIIFSADRADITCNECNAVVRSVRLEDLQRTLAEMEFALDVCTEM